MPFTSKWSTPIPNCSLQTYMFGSPSQSESDKPAFYDASRPETHYITRKEFVLWSKRVAAGLKAAGLTPGGRVLLFSGNNLFFPVVFMGIVMAGGIFTGANPTYVARELAYQLKDSDATFMLAAANKIDLALEAAESVGLSRSRVFIFDDALAKGHGRDYLDIKHWQVLIGTVQEGERYVWEDSFSPKDTTLCLNYSSGTTGVPKGVEITHYNYISNTLQSLHKRMLNPEYEAQNKVARSLCFLPLYHAYGQTVFITGDWIQGIPVYIMSSFDLAKMLEYVQRFRITMLTLVPPVVVAMAKSPLTKQFNLSSVIEASSGAAPLGREVSEEFERLWPNGQVNLKQGWGMTELTCSLITWDPRERSDSISVGVLNANCEAKVMNEDNTEEVPQGQRGELWIRAPNVMKGYWRNPKATAETLTPDGWLRSGDICYVDETEKFFIVDRLKELIKVKGLQVAPAELEAVLLDHPDVADAAVVGVTINGDEHPRAYIVRQEGSTTTGEEIAKWFQHRVSKHKRLTGGVKFIDIIPKNPSGKILRKFLREEAKKEVGDADVKPARL